MKGTKQSYDSKAKYFFPSIDAHMDAVRMRPFLPKINCQDLDYFLVCIERKLTHCSQLNQFGETPH